MEIKSNLVELDIDFTDISYKDIKENLRMKKLSLALFTLSILSISYGLLMTSWIYNLGGFTYWGVFISESLFYMPVVIGLFLGLLGLIVLNKK